MVVAAAVAERRKRGEVERGKRGDHRRVVRREVSIGRERTSAEREKINAEERGDE
jgi:hypothetical protein